MWCLAVPVGLMLLVVAFGGFYIDWEGRPFCHKQFHMGFSMWMQDRNTNAFPNVDGAGVASLLVAREQIGSIFWTNDYRYVPGLEKDDPGQLVLMYFNRPTRWKWHGAPQNRLKDKAWLIIPQDFRMGFRRTKGGGECSERLTTEEFKQRLRETLDFVRTNERPNWHEIVAEHGKFLEGLK